MGVHHQLLSPLLLVKELDYIDDEEHKALTVQQSPPPSPRPNTCRRPESPEIIEAAVVNC